MRKKEISSGARAIWRQYLFYVVTLFASFLIGLVIDIVLINIPLGLIVGHTGSLLEHVLHIVVTITTMFVLCYKEGYYKSRFTFKQLLISVALTFITQMVLVFFFGPSAWFSGTSIFIARYVFDAKHPELIGVAWSVTKEAIYNYRWFFMVVTFWTLYAPSMILGKYLGSKKGKKDSEKAKEEKNKEKTLNGHPFD